MIGSWSKQGEKKGGRFLKFFRRCFRRSRKDEKKKTETRDPVQNQMKGPVLDQTPVHSFRAAELEDRVRELERRLHQMTRECKQQKKSSKQTEMTLKESLADAELKHQKALESISQLEEEKSKLNKSVKTLRSKVRKLSEAPRQSEELQAESLTDAELKQQKALETISQLEEEKSELKKSVNQLRYKVRRLSEACRHSDELKAELKQQQEAHSAMQLKFEEMKEELMHKEKLLKESLADAKLKHQKSLEIISQLEKNKSELTRVVERQKSVVEQLGKELYSTYIRSDELQAELLQEQDTLQLEFDKMKKETMHKDEVLKELLDAAKSKH